MSNDSEKTPVVIEHPIGYLAELCEERDRHRDEARPLRGFIESIANGRSRPSMGDARRFLAELDASKNGKGGGE